MKRGTFPMTNTASHAHVCQDLSSFVSTILSSLCFPPSSSGITGGAVLLLGKVKGESWGHTRGEYLGFLGTSVKDFSS